MTQLLILNSYQVKHPSIHMLSIFLAEAHHSCHRARGKIRSRRVASASQCQHRDKWDKQPFTLTVTPTVNLESTVNLSPNHICCSLPDCLSSFVTSFPAVHSFVFLMSIWIWLAPGFCFLLNPWYYSSLLDCFGTRSVCGSRLLPAPCRLLCLLDWLSVFDFCPV